MRKGRLAVRQKLTILFLCKAGASLCYSIIKYISMIVSTPKIEQIGDNIRYIVNVKSEEGSNKILWFSLQSKYSSMVSDSADAALVGLLLPAMLQGDDIYIDAKVSQELLWNLLDPYQTLVINALPFLKKISIKARNLRRVESNPAGIATGFSGGIDSFYTLTRYYSDQTPDNLRLTHLLFNNVGSHGNKNEILFNQRYDELSAVSRMTGLPFIKVNSNLDTFYDDALHFELTHTIRNTSVVYMLQNGIKTYLYSSAVPFHDMVLVSGKKLVSMAYYDPVALPYLSHEGLRVLSSGSHLDRAQKTHEVSKNTISYSLLNVCTSTAKNCSACDKCMFTQFTLEITGRLERYSGVFDLSVYRKNKRKLLPRLLLGKGVAKKYAYANGYRFPLSAYLLVPSTFMSMNGLELKKLSQKIIRRIKKKIRGES